MQSNAYATAMEVPIAWSSASTAVSAVRDVSSPNFRGLRGRLLPLCYPQGAQLCMEGGEAAGVFGLCDGLAKECVSSDTGRTAILRIARGGDLIGLEAVIGNTPYPATVVTIEPTRAYFITLRELLGAMRCDESFRLEVAAQLSERCRWAYRDIRRLALSPSVPARIAQFLLDWREEGPRGRGTQGLHINLKHEEIAQAVCSSRESVSRIVTSFRRKGWIRVSGIVWTIQDRAALTALATGG